MNAKTESTISNSISNFGTLITTCKGYKQKYNPSNPWLQISSLEALRNRTSSSILDVRNAKRFFDDAVIHRRLLFGPLSKLASRLFSSFKVTNAPKARIDDLQAYIRKIQGTKVSGTSATPPPEGFENAPKTISTAQLGYVNKVNHLENLISVLESEPSYAPNEADLQVETLKKLAADMKAANEAVAEANDSYNTALNARNALLYAAENGMMATALDVKDYVKSVFTATSPEYKKVSKLPFRQRKDLKLPPISVAA